MKKENFVTLLLGTAGGLLFGVGMCMCMLPQWGAFRQGVAAGLGGLAVLVAMVVVRRRMQGKRPVHISGRTAAAAALGLAGVLALGVGMCMAMVWQGLLVPGIAVGAVGILLLLCLIPLAKGIE